MKQVQLKDIKRGQHFRRTPTSTTVWVKDVFFREVGKYSTYRFEDAQFSTGDTWVYID